MNIFSVLLFLMSSALLASCPLGYSPEQACPESNPFCALYVDADGDALCDNPGPQPAGESEHSEEIPPDTSETVSDTLITETESIPDTLPEPPLEEEISMPDESVIAEVPADTVTWMEESSSTESTEHEETIEYTYTQEDTVEELQIEFVPDSAVIDTVTIEEPVTPESTCPLDYTPEQACHENRPCCAFFTDADADQYCDNPGVRSDSASAAGTDTSGVTYCPATLAGGCPQGLPPEAACPTAASALSPHYMGWDGCANPSGGGINRTLIVLIATAVLLPVATCLKRRLRGRRKKDRRKRKIAHIIVQMISLIVLGFLIQGCFCPLGVMQYALLPGGLIFLGGLGIAVLMLPIIWTTFFDRIYCGWVCPFGALQDLLGKLHIPRPPKFSHKVHTILSGFRYLLMILFFAFIILSSSGQFANITPQAFFCRYDPFHTIFSFFIVGSFISAIVTMSILVFFPRFFCKYLCFYGAILSFLGRIGLWKRITRRHPCRDGRE
ncbi:MAG: 4Fe-4S binding protein, partial [Candidatus Fermentibacteria bacterium]